MKIYTKTGDAGDTGLFGGPRVAKDSTRIEAYGTVDELNAQLGLARAEGLPPDLDAVVERAQHTLFDLGAQLATPDPQKHGLPLVAEPAAAEIEQAIDHHESLLAPLKEFILPGGSKAAAQLHVARTLCRRAEREVVRLARDATPPLAPGAVIYLNRLGDLLFVLARRANQAAGLADVPWRGIS